LPYNREYVAGAREILMVPAVLNALAERMRLEMGVVN
jgi:hypothetical protein